MKSEMYKISVNIFKYFLLVSIIFVLIVLLSYFLSNYLFNGIFYLANTISPDFDIELAINEKEERREAITISGNFGSDGFITTAVLLRMGNHLYDISDDVYKKTQTDYLPPYVIINKVYPFSSDLTALDARYEYHGNSSPRRLFLMKNGTVIDSLNITYKDSSMFSWHGKRKTVRNNGLYIWEEETSDTLPLVTITEDGITTHTISMGMILNEITQKRRIAESKDEIIEKINIRSFLKSQDDVFMICEFDDDITEGYVFKVPPDMNSSLFDYYEYSGEVKYRNFYFNNGNKLILEMSENVNLTVPPEHIQVHSFIPKTQTYYQKILDSYKFNPTKSEKNMLTTIIKKTKNTRLRFFKPGSYHVSLSIAPYNHIYKRIRKRPF